ncbi:MAG: acyl-CoA thioesterase domain-containing protein [Myxococcota bacterium]|nr:acyl-CoA thioesterase domain-containing protein [Myxococcota bacterium]
MGRTGSPQADEDTTGTIPVNALSLSDLLACMELTPCGEDRFTAPNLPIDYRRVFGGQLLAQAIIAAATSAPEQTVKSLHVAFPREGERDATTEIAVTRIHSGRTFSSRQVSISQGQTPILIGTALLHREEPGPDFQSIERTPAGPDAATPVDMPLIPWETRLAAGVDLESRSVGPAQTELWIRAAESPPDPTAQQALLAHATDLNLIGTAMRAMPDLSQADAPERVQTAVVSHSVWFHRPIDLRNWVCLQQEAPVTTGSRGFGRGDALCEDGRAVAAFSQESLIRLRN